MSDKHNPDEIARLIAEAREDDARVSGSRWYSDRPILGAPPRPVVAHLVGACVYPADGCWTHGVPSDVDAAAIARMRNNLRAIADQLEAQRAEIERWKDEEHRQRGIATKERENADRFAKLWDHDVKAVESVLNERTAERDKLQAELEAARREVAVMRPVVEAAERQRDRNDDDTDDVFAAVDAYRAARDKAGG